MKSSSKLAAFFRVPAVTHTTVAPAPPLTPASPTTKAPPTERITIEACQDRLESIIGKTYTVPKTKNKGNAGHYLETLLGIPHSSECLDCLDGELKAFPLKTLKSGELVPKETVAVTMCCSTALKENSFDESKLSKKLSKTLFVPYTWSDEGELVFFRPFLFTTTNSLWQIIKEDYEAIKTKSAEGVMTGSIGTYLQTRTKGAGHGSTSRAFYLRPQFLKTIFPDGFKTS